MVSMRLQELPKTSPRCPKMAHMALNMTKMGQDGPKGTQGGPKMGPRWTQEDSKGVKLGPKNEKQYVSKNIDFPLFFH